MKKIARNIFLVILILMTMINYIILVSSASLSASNNTVISQYPYEKYEYPITPNGTPNEWKKFTSHTEMLDACEIPEEILKDLSTGELLLTCIGYPLAGDMLCYNNFEDGFKTVKENFNGLCELYERDDFSNTLSFYYNCLDVNTLKQISGESNMDLFFLSAITKYAIQEEKLSPCDTLSIANRCKSIASELPKDNIERNLFSTLYDELSKSNLK